MSKACFWSNAEVDVSVKFAVDNDNFKTHLRGKHIKEIEKEIVAILTKHLKVDGKKPVDITAHMSYHD